jgi:uncharacterized delta-60 repeat protein
MVRREAGTWSAALCAIVALLVGFAPAAKATEMEVQPDGKILLAGTTPLYSGYVARLLPSGEPDPTFGVEGVVVDHRLGWTVSLALQADGRILALGADGEIARYWPDGRLDQAFGEDGYARVVYPLDDLLELLVLPDGRIAVGGTAVEKLFPSEALVEVFSPDGSESWLSGTGLGTRMTAMGAAKDGSLIVAEGGESASRKGFLARFVPGSVPGYPTPFDIRQIPHPDPGYDRSFGAGAGFARFAFPGVKYSFGSQLVALASSGDGMVAVGRSEGRLAVARFDGQGLLDRSFGRGGFAFFDGPGRAAARDVEPSGEKTLVVGDRHPRRYRECPSCATPLLMRLTSDGRLDHSFGRRGIAGLPGVARPQHGARGEAVAALPSGKILMAGQTSGPSASVVGRLKSNGSPDRSFGSGGVLRYRPCAGGERKQRRIGCLPSARAELQLRRARGGVALRLEVRPVDDWAGIESVTLWPPKSLRVAPAQVERARFSYLDARGRTQRVPAYLKDNGSLAFFHRGSHEPERVALVVPGGVLRWSGSGGGGPLAFRARIGLAAEYSLAGHQTLTLRGVVEPSR